jgi:hypothetical protein
MTTKPSICNGDAFCKSDVYARKATNLTLGDLLWVLETELGLWKRRLNSTGEVSRGNSRW